MAYRIAENPQLKTPIVSTYESTLYAYNDGVNYLSLDETFDVKVGW